jgi:hypothetical protein
VSVPTDRHGSIPTGPWNPLVGLPGQVVNPLRLQRGQTFRLNNLKMNQTELNEWNHPGYTRGGKYHCTVDLLFDWFGISLMATDNFLQNILIQTSQTGGQWYCDTSPFSIPCIILKVSSEIKRRHDTWYNDTWHNGTQNDELLHSPEHVL